jgi:hypothetical protein
MMNQQFTQADLDAYANYIVQDYKKMYGGELPAHSIGFSVEFEPGSKFIRVVTQNGSSRSSHSFLDAQGNIWKAASWKAPAKNFIRGNIVTRDYSRIAWTGAR